MNSARPKRQVALLIVLFIHGLVFLGGFCALGAFATVESLSPDSEPNRAHRAPRADEAARGEVWFSGHITDLVPARNDAGARRPSDPWNGCSLRRQSYRSGKNAGWYDQGSTYSYGAARIVSDVGGTNDGRTVEVPLHELGSGTRTVLHDDEAVAMMSTAQPSDSSHHWVRDCFRTGWEVTVDGIVGSDGVLVTMPGRRATRFETREARVSRLESEAMWCAMGPLAFAGGLAWLAIFLSVLRAPSHLGNLFGAAFGKHLSGSSLAIAMPFVGLACGAGSGVLLFHSAAPLVIYLAAFSSFGLVLRWNARSFSLRRRLGAVLSGEEILGVAAAWGKVARPDGKPSDGGAAWKVVATEVFALSSKGALGTKVHTHVAPDLFTVVDEDVTSTCDGSSGNFFGEYEQQNEGGHDVRQSPYGSPALSANRYAVRVTTLEAGAEVVVVGPVVKSADSRATANDSAVAGEHAGYRGSGTARFFRRDGAARVVVCQGTREELRAQLERDLATLRIYRAFLGLWFAAALSTLALAAKYPLFH